MIESTQRHPLKAYFFLACTISWVIWTPLVATSLDVNAPLLPYHHFIGALGPVLAALIVTGISEGESGLRRLFGQIVQWRVGFHWYLIALLSPVALFGIASAISRVFGAAWPDFSEFGTSDEFPHFGWVATWLFHTLTFGIGEEVGWRGYALPRLQKKRTAFSATLILSVFWAVWHLPTFWYRTGYSSLPPVGVVGWFFSLFTGAILLTWLYNSSKGSILIVSLFHGSIDVAFTSKVVQGATVNIMGGLIVVWAIIVLFVAGPKHLTRNGKQMFPVSFSLEDNKL